MGVPDNPLTAPAPAEVPLPQAPLIRVVAQVRFPQVLSVDRREFVAPFQEAIRACYPVLRVEQGRSLVIGGPGAGAAPPHAIWRFEDPDAGWRVSLAPSFLALETTAYGSRHDFLERLRGVLQALDEHVDPKVIDRLGVRYIDRISGPDLENLGQLVRPEMLGVLASPLGEHAEHALTETVLSAPESAAKILARWGRVPGDVTPDPAAIGPTSEPSWILDLDMFRMEQRRFEVDATLREAEQFAERIYALFRWAVTEDFLRRFGGEP